MNNTPETDAAWDKYINFPYTYGAGDLRILAQRLECERNKARELAQQMSESNQVLQAEVRDYRKTADNTPLSNNEMHLNLVLQEVAKLAKTLKRERDEAQYNLENARKSLEVAIEEINGMKKAILETLEQNRNLADGDDCTLYKLKSVIEFWE